MEKSVKSRIINISGVGYMTDEFLMIGNISLQCGRMPVKDDEAAIEWDSLIKLNQGT